MRRVLADRYLTGGDIGLGVRFSGDTVAIGLTGCDWPAVHVRLYQGDGSTYGVGMPIIAYLSAGITDARAFTAATRVTVNGSAVPGAWPGISAGADSIAAA